MVLKRGACALSQMHLRHGALNQPMGQQLDPQTLGDLCSDTRGLENTVKIPGFQAVLQERDAAGRRMAVLLELYPWLKG